MVPLTSDLTSLGSVHVHNTYSMGSHQCTGLYIAKESGGSNHIGYHDVRLQEMVMVIRKLEAAGH